MEKKETHYSLPRNTLSNNNSVRDACLPCMQASSAPESAHKLSKVSYDFTSGIIVCY